MSPVLHAVKEVLKMKDIDEKYQELAIRLVSTWPEKLDHIMYLAARFNSASEEDRPTAEVAFTALLEEEMVWQETEDMVAQAHG